MKPDQYKLDTFAAKMCKDAKSLVFSKVRKVYDDVMVTSC